MTQEQMFVTGAKKDPKDKRDFRLAGIVGGIDIPKQVFELKEDFPSNNQYSRPSCTSQAQSHHKERQEKKQISARYIMAKTKALEGNTDWGAYTRDTFKVVKDYGACSEDLMPEPTPSMSWVDYINTAFITKEMEEDAQKHKSQSFWRVEKNIDALRSALVSTNNSVEASMAWYSEFNRPDNGILPANYNNYAGGHAVEACGFDDFKELIKFKNSWGIGWGVGGFFYMPYAMFNNLVWDLWCSLDIPETVPVDDYYGQKRTWSSFLREQSMAFNPWLKLKIGRLPNNREIKGLAYGFWSYNAVFEGKVGDLWLNKTKPQAIIDGNIDNQENLIIK